MQAPRDQIPKLRPLRELIWESPLVPVALAVTAGLVVDRYLGVSLLAVLCGFGGAIVIWVVFAWQRLRWAPLAMCVAAGFLAAGYHHGYRNYFPSDNIGNFAPTDPVLVRLRGILNEEPTPIWKSRDDPLTSYVSPDPTRGVLDVRQIRSGTDWAPVSGLARLSVQGHLEGFHVGDEVEVIGWLSAPGLPANPGERDHVEYLRDRRIRADVFVRKTPEGVTRLTEGSTVSGWLAQLRGWGQRTFERQLPKGEAGVASALVLGEGSSMTSADWDKYIRTGVIHVLAISGQHLVILAAFIWVLLRFFCVSRRRGALIVAVLLFAYSLLTGFHPPVQRAAVAVIVHCLGMLLRRAPLPANTYALSWLVVIALNPTDPFTMGCQLAFLQVAVLIWGIARWLERDEESDIERLRDETRTITERLLRGFARAIGHSYGITLILGIVSIPLIASWQHLISLSGFLIGPPMILLTSIALISGFLVLLADALGGFLTPIPAFIMRWSLAGCDGLVDGAEHLPFSHAWVPDVPQWWLWVFYLVLLAGLWWKPLWPRQRWLLPAGVGWLCVGVLGGALRLPDNEVRVTFLAVGHGGCTVIETPDGRTLVYDAGAIGGPDVTRRQIAPYLWSRGIWKIDELFVSHADLDHFNGVAGLLERFDVGLITLTPSFSDKQLPGVRYTLAEIERRKIPVRIVHAGDRLTVGEVTLDVLHPPPKGPDGNENARSMVLLLQHAGHSVLLTGDLDGPAPRQPHRQHAQPRPLGPAQTGRLMPGPAARQRLPRSLRCCERDCVGHIPARGSDCS